MVVRISADIYIDYSCCGHNCKKYKMKTLTYFWGLFFRVVFRINGKLNFLEKLKNCIISVCYQLTFQIVIIPPGQPVHNNSGRKDKII